MDGIINVLKPPGLTSRQVVSIIKGITKEKKVGHAGTLDPGASGVLPIMIGKATKLFDYIGENKKEYIAEFSFGKSTETQDSYGNVIHEENVDISQEQIIEVLSSFIGEYEQTPSIYSAIHINGKRAYDYAYAGQEIELPKRCVRIYDAELISKTSKASYLVRVLCSKGCYIRSLCEDVAKKLGTVAYLSVLIRTRTGQFDIGTSYTLDELQNFSSRYLISLEEVLKELPCLCVEEQWNKALYNGNKLPLSMFLEVNDNMVYKICDSNGVLWALGQKDEDIVRIKQMLRDKQ